MIRESIRSKQASSDPDLRYFIDGEWWMQDSFQAWQSAFPWLTKRTIIQYLDDLSSKCYHDGPKCEGSEGCSNPYVVKKTLSANGNKLPNYYRLNPNWVPTIGQNDSDPSEKISPPLVKKFHHPSEKISLSSYSNNLTSNQTKKEAPPLEFKEKVNSVDTNIAKAWLGHIEAQGLRIEKGWSVESWANELARIRRLDNRSIEEMERVINHIMRTPFWTKNCRCPMTLRNKNENGQTKIETILAQAMPARVLKKGYRYTDALPKEQEAIVDTCPASIEPIDLDWDTDLPECPF